MTDLEKFVELYKSFGIELKPKQWEDSCYRYEGEESYSYIYIWSDGLKMEGGMDFFSQVVFDGNGKFIRQGFWG